MPCNTHVTSVEANRNLKQTAHWIGLGYGGSVALVLKLATSIFSNGVI